MAFNSLPPLPDPAASREERLEDLYRIVCHGTTDFLNFLVVIDGCAELLERQNCTGQEYLSEIRKSTKRASELIYYFARATRAVGDTPEFDAWSRAFYHPDSIQEECGSDEPSMIIAPAPSPEIP